MKLAQFSKRGERKFFNNWLELLVDYLIGNVIDRWRFDETQVGLFDRGFVFGSSIFVQTRTESAPWREFYQVFTFSIARRRGLRNDTAIC